MLKGLVLLLAVAVWCLIGVEAGRSKSPPAPKTCPKGTFTTKDECYKNCKKDDYKSCRSCEPWEDKKNHCWSCVCKSVVFKDAKCCYDEGDCGDEGKCYKYKCEKSKKSGYSYCKKELKVEYVSFAKKDCGKDCPEEVECCYPPDDEHKDPYCPEGYWPCNKYYECKKKD